MVNLKAYMEVEFQDIPKGIDEANRWASYIDLSGDSLGRLNISHHISYVVIKLLFS